jgi:hypothetical protein
VAPEDTELRRGGWVGRSRRNPHDREQSFQSLKASGVMKAYVYRGCGCDGLITSALSSANVELLELHPGVPSPGHRTYPFGAPQTVCFLGFFELFPRA